MRGFFMSTIKAVGGTLFPASVSLPVFGANAGMKSGIPVTLP